jgi:hypothetical protein
MGVNELYDSLPGNCFFQVQRLGGPLEKVRERLRQSRRVDKSPAAASAVNALSMSRKNGRNQKMGV